jgi:hypothetical protein
MVLPSSPPAQAASTIGSNMIAVRFADFPNATRLQRFDAQLGSSPFAYQKESAFGTRRPRPCPECGTGPAPLGKQWHADRV